MRDRPYPGLSPIGLPALPALTTGRNNRQLAKVRNRYTFAIVNSSERIREATPMQNVDTLHLSCLILRFRRQLVLRLYCHPTAVVDRGQLGVSKSQNWFGC